MPTALADPPATKLDPETLARAQKDYEAALERIRSHAEIHFRGIRDPGTRDDAIAETIGIGWKHWLSALAHGKNPNDFVSVIADMSVRHVKSHRRVAGSERAKDAMSPSAHRRHGFYTEQLDDSHQRSHTEIYGDPHGQERADASEEYLHDSSQTPPDKQARVGWLDVPAWLTQLGDRNERIARDMMKEEDTKDLAAKHEISQSRVSQLRRQFAQNWKRFHDGDEGRGR